MYGLRCFALVALLSPSTLCLDSSLVIHERRAQHITSEHPGERTPIEPDALLPMRIGLKPTQNALLSAENWLMDVSDPTSTNFGRHWTQDDVIEAFSPTDDTIEIVMDWLLSHGVLNITLSDNKQWLAFEVTAGEAEDMLKTNYYEHAVRSKSGEVAGFEASTDQYSIPQYLTSHIDLIKPGLQGVDVTGRTARSRKFLESLEADSIERRFYCPVGGGLVIDGHKTRIYDHAKPLPANPPCSDLVTPACIRELYDIPLADPGSQVSSNNTLGVFSTGDLFYQGSLDLFNQRYTNVPAGYAPIFHDVDNSQYPPTHPHGKYWKLVAGEGNTDLEAAMPIIYPQNITVFHMKEYDNFFNKFDDAIDGSYCLPSQKAGKRECGIFKPTNVISISYSQDERAYSPFWLQRQCLEYLKLGLQGVSMFISSGDYGVGGSCNGTFKPEFPPSCSWITTVGATEIRRNGTLWEPEIAASQYLKNDKGKPESSFSSGGGFSNHFPRPKYQQDAVSHYFKTANLSLPYFQNGNTNSSGKYNRDGRGYPDISANGKKVALCGWNLCKQLNCSHSAGTSISTPIVAAIFDRIIEERIRVGRGPLGFINPILYQYPEALNDVTSGGNGACTPKAGFLSAPGWDPITGLGTPNYPKLLDVFMKLP